MLGEYYLIIIQDVMGCEVEQAMFWLVVYECIVDLLVLMELKLGLIDML